MKAVDFCEKVDKYRKQLYVAAYVILRNEADAEDAVCNAVLKGYEHLGQLKNPGKFKPWLFAITRNEALKILKKRVELPGDETVRELLKPVYDSHNELWDMVQSLKEEYRLVIALFYYCGLSLKDISRTLDIPTGTVKSRLNRGRELLKQQLEEEERGCLHDGIR